MTTIYNSKLKRICKIPCEKTGEKNPRWLVQAAIFQPPGPKTTKTKHNRNKMNHQLRLFFRVLSIVYGDSPEATDTEPDRCQASGSIFLKIAARPRRSTQRLR